MAILTEAEEKIFSEIEQKLLHYSYPFAEVDKQFLISNEKELTLINKGKLFQLATKEADISISQACHIVSSYLWLTNQVDVLCTGFALIEEECVEDVWYHHSFCIKDNIIIEPTPRGRDKYFGIELDLEASIDLCLDTVDWFEQYSDKLKINRAEIETMNRYLLLAKGV